MVFCLRGLGDNDPALSRRGPGFESRRGHLCVKCAMPNWSINKIKFESWAGHGIERCENPQRGLEKLNFKS